ncbi:type II toxin-antitoxin system PemK/MazF family toxin [Microbacterium horticulturae]|uniref:mRNA interferase n=1 Tax=Microbacterium horticulturae TaxID=3028316 RepID=A0ABY8C2H6_9MICO|nr:type II toxin-antitoxin system PemK/MazF family toxin [Microbacterium sp. KACC 23027]WEG08823.1 type II toxin-antitoxin system PemK/MazF family toxin [Microbacterium sp. KACC 23027]
MSGELPFVRRGAIVLVDLDPSDGSEAAKLRPAVVVSNNTANAAALRTGRGVLTVVPVTSNTEKVYPFQVLLPAASTGLSRDSKAQAEQLRAVSLLRVRRVVGWVPGDLMAGLDAAVRLHLAL